ncbi:hypothetical protein PACTADRAFT_75131 [Pachysolen tannophilus NRRL Y-2460]|uniref:Replication factor C subunit 1 n=1 Tax=Pachysolen tannophilus NRRL Y-2460 TaxID=669874 RepID=A0A1E4TVZ1_PACTA|nr:hypothetical protein PACTADRAFT_75131 [Pachysolen tannophilus NRRL Y-2460]
MVDIREFFGNSQQKQKKRPHARSKKDQDNHDDVQIIEDDQDSPSVKKTKLEPSATESKYFNKEKEGKADVNGKNHDKKSKEVINLDDDDAFNDGDFDEIEARFKSPKTSQSQVKTLSPEKKQQAISGPKKEKPNGTSPIKKPKQEIKSESAIFDKPIVDKQVTAEEILKTIADAQLPDKKDMTGMSFRDFKKQQESLPQPSGSREIPKGRPNCLNGLTVVFTGVLPTLDRPQAEQLAAQYGAKVTKSISSRTSLVVLGNEAGPSKVEKIRKFKIKAIDEDGFIQLISSMPADGGEGEAALKAKKKREEEEAKVLEDAQRMIEEEELKEKEKKEKAKHLQKNSQSRSTGDNVPITADKISDRPDSDRLWTVKYAPTNIAQICGNKGQVGKLQRWLENFEHYRKMGFKEPGPDGSGIFRAVLIHGPPGIGKTTAAHIVAKSLGYDILEKNASDVRSKMLLNSNIKSVLNNTSLVGFFNKDKEGEANHKKFVLIMDEVDGMSSGDHGGVGALSAFCRTTSTPMILICNDKSLPKMRPFDRVTYDLPFRRPSAQEMKSRLMTICLREKIKLDPNIINELVQVSQNDIRQIINTLSSLSRNSNSIGFSNSKEINQNKKVTTTIRPFEITSRLLGNSHLSMNEKSDLFFNDIDFTPLFVHENYINTSRSTDSQISHLEALSKAADCISESDLVNQKIRFSQEWSLLPFFGILSSVLPSSYVTGLNARINFTSYLGQNSKKQKMLRELQNLYYHSSALNTTSPQSEFIDYIPLMQQNLKMSNTEDIDKVIKYMDDYYMTKDDYPIIMEDFQFGKNAFKTDTKIKTAFTKKYNSLVHPVAIFRIGNSVGSGRGVSSEPKPDTDEVIAEDDDVVDETNEDDDDSEGDIKKDKLIKAVKSKSKTAAGNKTTSTTKKNSRAKPKKN